MVWISLLLQTISADKKWEVNPGIATRNKNGLCHSKLIGLPYKRSICCNQLDVVDPKSGLCVSPCALKHQLFRYNEQGELSCKCAKPFEKERGKSLETAKCACRSPRGVSYGPIVVDGEDVCCIGEPELLGKEGPKCRNDDGVNSDKVNCPYLSRWSETSRQCVCSVSGQTIIDGFCVCIDSSQIIDAKKGSCVSRCNPHQRWDEFLNTCVCDPKHLSVGHLGQLTCVPATLTKHIHEHAKKTIRCAKFETLDRGKCVCITGFWRDPKGGPCQKKSDCGKLLHQVYNIQNNTCQCKKGYERWVNKACLPPCKPKNSHRVGNSNGTCECELGYSWEDDYKLTCVKDPECGKLEVYDRASKQCICRKRHGEKLGRSGAPGANGNRGSLGKSGSAPGILKKSKE